MSRLSTFLALFFLSGLAAFLLLRRVAPTPSAATATTPSASAELAALRVENGRLKAEIAIRSMPPPAPDRTSRADDNAARIEHLKLLRDWVSKQRVFLAVRMLGPDGKLSDDFVDLFGISPTERANLETATAQAQQELARLSVNRATVGRNPEGNYVIRVPSFLAEGRAVYDQVSEAIQSTLGPEKGRLFLSLMGDSLEPTFSMFGAQERTITLERTIASDGHPLFGLNDRRYRGDVSSTSGSTAMSFAQLKTYPGYKDLLELLPPDAGGN